MELGTHPDRQFPSHFVDHMPSCVMGLLCSLGAGGVVILAIFRRGCGDTVMHRWVLINNGGYLGYVQGVERPLQKLHEDRDRRLLS